MSMSTRSTVMPTLASGTATAVKLLVATLAFAGAYVGVEASNAASGHASAASAPGAHRSDAARTRTLSARAVPIESARRPRPGTVSVSASSMEESGERCDRVFRVESVVNGSADSTQYAWRLMRWSGVSHKWQTYMTSQAGFAGATRAVEWHLHIVGNPGWYKIELAVYPKGTYGSDRFMVSC
jgi:hypothetical protein